MARISRVSETPSHADRSTDDPVLAAQINVYFRPMLCENAMVDMRHATIRSPRNRSHSKDSTRGPAATRKCSLSLRYDVFTQPRPKADMRILPTAHSWFLFQWNIALRLRIRERTEVFRKGCLVKASHSGKVVCPVEAKWVLRKTTSFLSCFSSAVDQRPVSAVMGHSVRQMCIERRDQSDHKHSLNLYQ